MMSTNPANTKLIGALLGAGIIGIEMIGILTAMYRFPASTLPHYGIVSLLLWVLLFALYIFILGFGYGRLRRILPNDKAQWLTVLIVTAVQAAFVPIKTLLLPLITLHTRQGDEYFVQFDLTASLISLIISFLIALGVVHIMAQLYKRRSGFEVE